jgi:A/G-specific adenine glycosylase
LPVKLKKTKVKNRFFNYLFIRQGNFFYLEKREKNDIWRNLYQLPLIESLKALTINELLTHDEFKPMFEGLEISIDSISPEIIHILTHQKLHVRFIEITIVSPKANYLWIRVYSDNIHDFPVPKLIDNYLLEKNQKTL